MFTVFFVNQSTGASASMLMESDCMSLAQLRFLQELRKQGLLKRGDCYKSTVCSKDRPLDDFPIYLFTNDSCTKKAR